MIAQENEQDFESVLQNTKSYNIGNIIKYIQLSGGLTKEQTILLFQRYVEEKDKGVDAEDSIYRTILIIAYDRFIGYILNKMHIYDEDSYSTGKLGLIKAIDTFDISKGIQFMSYASHCIKNEVLMNVRKEQPNSFLNGKAISIDDAVNDNDEHFSLYEIIKSDEDVAREVADADEIKSIFNLFKYLLPIEQYCVIANLGIYGLPLKQNVIAEKTKLSQPYISRILTSAYDKLKLLANENILTEEEQIKSNQLHKRHYSILTKQEYENFSFERQDNKMRLIEQKVVEIKHNKKQVLSSKSDVPIISNVEIKEVIKENNKPITRFNLQNYIKQRPKDKKECREYMLRFLRPLEQICIIYRFGLYGKQLWTLAEIARKINWSKELLQPVYNGALKKMDLLVKNLDSMTDMEKKNFKEITKQNYDVITKETYLKYGKNGKNCLGL